MDAMPGHRRVADRRWTRPLRGTPLLLLSLAALIVTPAARADTFVVTTTADTVAADGQTSLREAVLAANANAVADTIVLGAGQTYTLNQCADAPLSVGGPAALMISGNGATVAQSCPDTHIIVKGAPNTTTLTLQNLVLQPGPSSGVNVQGAAVQASSQLVLDSVSVVGANAGFGGSLVEIDFGPASFDLIVTNSSFTNSTGSALTNQNPAGMQVTGSTISGNTGAGISLGDGSPLEITNTTITNQGGVGVSTTGQGFGLQPEVTISGSNISGNGGGGFWCGTSCRTLTVTNSTISDNGASAPAGRGGGLVMPIVLAGGANPTVSISGSTIHNNQASHPGGGLWVAMSFASSAAVQPEVQIVDTTISGNHSNCAACAGGGVAVSVGNVLITGSTLSANVASGDGGGLAISRSPGADIPVTAMLTLTDSVVSGNSAGGQGGGLSVQVDQALVQDSWIHGNTAATDGGGISAGGVFNPGRVVSGDMQIQDSTLSGNSAQRGGAVKLSFPDGSRVQMLNSTVDGNAASVAGGGFLVGPTERLDLDHSTVTRNSAPASANLATNGPTHIARSVIAQPVGPASCGLIVPAAPVLTVPHLVSEGRNVFGDASCAPAATDTVLPAGDPQLGELLDNGGPTPTRLPADGSPVVGVVPLAECTTPEDQRGLPRPGGSACEAGAVEVVGLTPGPAGPARLTADGDLLLRLRHDREAVRLVFGAGAVQIQYDADRGDPGNALVTQNFSGPFRDLRLRARGGQDRIEIENPALNRDLDLRLGRGPDELRIQGGQVRGRTRLLAGPGSEAIHIDGLKTRSLDLWLGAGDDRLVLENCRVGPGPTRVLAGPGDDKLRISGCEFGGPVLLQGGGGRDRLDLGPDNHYLRRPQVGGFGGH